MNGSAPVVILRIVACIVSRTFQLVLDRLAVYTAAAYVKIGLIYILNVWSFEFIDSRFFPLIIGYSMNLAALALLTALLTWLKNFSCLSMMIPSTSFGRTSLSVVLACLFSEYPGLTCSKT